MDVPLVICVVVDVICECAGESHRPGGTLVTNSMVILVRPSNSREREPDNPPEDWCGRNISGLCKSGSL